jgi:dolichol-phosphate mannosyltransferase
MDAEGWFKVTSARAFYRLINWMTALDLPNGGADFRYMSRTIVDAMLQMPERHRFLRGMARWVGYRHATVEYERALRPAGESKYTFRRMLRFAWDAIVGFSALPLRIASVLGIIVSMLGGFYAMYVVGINIFTNDTVPGWTSVVVAVLVLGGVQLACIGIIGQYLGRMYEEIKGRPLFIVWEDTRRPERTGPGMSVRDRR